LLGLNVRANRLKTSEGPSINDIMLFWPILDPLVTRHHKKSDPLKYDITKLPTPKRDLFPVSRNNLFRINFIIVGNVFNETLHSDVAENNFRRRLWVARVAKINTIPLEMFVIPLALHMFRIIILFSLLELSNDIIYYR